MEGMKKGHNYDEVEVAYDRRLTVRQSRQREKNDRLYELKQMQADRRALQTMKDKVEILNIEVEYLEVHNDKRDEIKFAVESLLCCLKQER